MVTSSVAPAVTTAATAPKCTSKGPDVKMVTFNGGYWTMDVGGTMIFPHF
jgi:hypothetical protein